MGDIIGGIIGGIGSIIGGNKAAKAQQQAAQTALTGYNYLSSGAGAAPTHQIIQNGQDADAALNSSLAGQAGQAAQYGGNAAQANSSAAQLLGQQPITDQTQNGLSNYLNSTGYQFQLGQGTQAITGSAASKGLLNSGSTAKALQSYGQGLAGQSFNNYLGQLGALQGQSAAGQQQYVSNLNAVGQRGQNMVATVGAAGNTGGGNAAQAQSQAGESAGTGISQAANYFGGGAQNAVNSGQLANFFG